jgi:alpha-tubulin suppressor-like RCC1 family protein
MRTLAVLLLLVSALVSSVIVLVAPGSPAGAQSAPAAGAYVPLSPARILDTRDAGSGGPIAAQTSRDIQVTGGGGVPTTDVLAVAVTVAAFNNTTEGWGLMWQAGTTRPNPASNINYIPGKVVNNAITSRVSAAGKVSFYTLSATDITVDVVGYYRSSPGGGGYVALSQTRFLDTRTEGGKVAAGTTFYRKLRGVAGIPDSTAVTAVALNMSTFNQEAHGLSIVYPRGQARPNTSTMNYVPWHIQTQLVLAKLSGDGLSNFYVSTTTDMVLDIVGYYTEGSGAQFVPLPSTRVIDTRYNIPGWGKGPITQALAAGTHTAIKLTGLGGVPESGVSAVLVNATADTVGSAPGFLTFWASGDTQPDTNNLTYYANEDRSNLVIAKVGADGKAIVTNSFGTTALALDVVGYFSNDSGALTPRKPRTTPIAAGHGHSLAITTSGKVLAGGDNDHGQLGDGTVDGRQEPREVRVGDGPLTGVISVAAGGTHSLALKADGTVWAWGDNSLGQLGDGSRIQRSTAVQAHFVSRVVAIGAGGHHSMAVLADGSVWSWGNNSVGQLGDGNLDPADYTAIPIRAEGLSNAVAVAGGLAHSLALKSDGSVWAWGANDMGQIGGDGSSPVPRPVAGVSGANSVAAGNDHSLVSTANGTVLAWGSNSSSQLGPNASLSVSRSPVVVSGLPAVAHVAAGFLHSVGLGTDGSVWGWGANDEYQLGLGFIVPARFAIPQRLVLPNGNFFVDGVTVAAGGKHSLGVTGNGSLFEWGRHRGGFCMVATLVVLGALVLLPFVIGGSPPSSNPPPRPTANCDDGEIPTNLDNPIDIKTASLTTATDLEDLIHYVEMANSWLAKAGPQIVQKTTDTQLGRDKNRAVAAEKKRAADQNNAYDSATEVPGHVPDTAVAGTGEPPCGFLRMTPASNAAAAGPIGNAAKTGATVSHFTIDGKIPRGGVLPD